MWLSDNEISLFIENLPNLDLRISNNGRWIDQKCTPDVLSIVADCIGEFVSHLPSKDEEFTSQDIWHSGYTKDNVYAVFQKPNVNADDAVAEYNKFFMQPMELLAYSGVLSKRKKGHQNFYKVENFQVLNYVATKERNALHFLVNYISKVLKDSDIYYAFEHFFANQDANQFETLKDLYVNFIIKNTRINGRTETSRIFTKVINPLSYFKHAKGTKKGHISKQVISYDMLMYNRMNFRDIVSNKPKDQTRTGYILTCGKRTVSINALRKYIVEKAKRMVREYNLANNAGMPELSRDAGFERGSHVHHIFPESLFPSIASYVENLICLNPSQHLNHAHPQGITYKIDSEYQQFCLLAKTDTIEKDIIDGLNFYDFFSFLEVLSTGFNDDSFKKIKINDFDSLRCSIIGMYLKP